MNTSGSTTAIGFLRRITAGALLAGAITATSLGVAATGHADTGAPAPDTDAPGIVSGLITPWLPTIDRWGGLWRYYCAPHYDGHWRCD